MKKLLVSIALLSSLAWPPAGGAWQETEGCKVDGGSTGSGGTSCPTSGEWYDVTWSVTALCRNTCTGNTWQRNSSTQSLTSSLSCSSCPLKVQCDGCTRAITAQQVEYYTRIDKRKQGSLFGGCETVSSKTARVTCDCPGCGEPSPILISLLDGDYELTNVANGVLFDLDGDGVAERTAWTAAGSDEGFLVLDRNLNGRVDDYMEVFGDHTPQLPSDEPNGWLALAVWDDSLNGGNEDGVIDAGDRIFSALQIWVDDNHNGFSEPEELSSLEDEGLEYLSLDYGNDEWVDDFGNGFKFPSKVGRVDGEDIIAWDVFFGQ